MEKTEQNIIKTLAYFNLFQYPITKEELLLFHSENVKDCFLERSLDNLCRAGIIFRLDEFYSLQNDRSLVVRRRSGNKMAITHMHRAFRAAKILAAFPFIQGLAISGSLSKKYADENTDIDFFVITSTNRLWIARTWMHLYKKLTFLTGKQHWFCMNYYVDKDALEITEKNIFTAMEIVTLLPMYGRSGLTQFIQNNKWTAGYFPSCSPATGEVPEMGRPYFKRLIEFIFKNKFGDIIDNLLMNITDRRWAKKVARKKKSEKGIPFGMIISKHISKPDPKNFQKKIVEQYEKCFQELMEEQQRKFVFGI